jgi:hypothetical protein
MKSLRLKIRKHSKSHKIRKGGNGNNFNTVLDLIKNCVLLKYEDDNCDPRKKPVNKEVSNSDKNNILSILQNPQFNLSELNERETHELLLNVIELGDNEILDAYLNHQNPNLDENILIKILDKI